MRRLVTLTLLSGALMAATLRPSSWAAPLATRPEPTPSPDWRRLDRVPAGEVVRLAVNDDPYLVVEPHPTDPWGPPQARTYQLVNLRTGRIVPGDDKTWCQPAYRARLDARFNGGYATVDYLDAVGVERDRELWP